MSKEATRIQNGAVVDYTATGTIANGDVIPLADRIGIANNDAVAGDVISLELEGVFEIAAATADAISFGVKVYFDATNRNVTTTSTDNTLAGLTVSEKAAATDGSVYVKIG